MSRRDSFTLIELLVVIGIVAILSVAVLLALNPTQLMAQGRDATRLNDLDTLQHALSLYQVEQSNFGSSTVVYVSVPDPSLSGNSTNTCTNLGLPALPAGYNYQCVSNQNLQKTDGTGWLPVNLTQITSKPLSQLPLDPINTTSSGNYYTYVTNGSQWELTAVAESQKYKSQTNSKTNFQPGLLAQGTNLTLSPLFNSSGLVGYWPLDEGTGTIAYDQSGNGNNGTWSGTSGGDNGSYYTIGKMGKAGWFNGNNDVITIGNPSSLYFDTGPFTAVAWVNTTMAPNPNSFEGWMSKGGYPSGLELRFLVTSGGGKQIGGIISGLNNAMDTSYNWSGNQWYQTAFTRDNIGNWIMYVNGSPINQGTGFTNSVGTSTLWTIGNMRGGSFWWGYLDDLRLYTRALSTSEIQAIYNATK